MSNLPFYPASQPGGAYHYSANPQGMPTQTPYQTQFVMMPNVQPGSQGQQHGYAMQQQYSMHHGNHAYMQQGPPRGGRTEQFGQVVIGAPFPPQAGQGQHAGLQQVLMPVPQYMNQQSVPISSFSGPMSSFSGPSQWQNNSQYGNGPQPSHAPNSFAAQPKKPDHRSQQPMYYMLNNQPITQQVGQGPPNVLPQQSSIQQQPTKQNKPRTSAIQIIDPNTGAEVKTEDLAKTSSSVNNLSASSAGDTILSVSPAAANQVAADFAARVAATLNTSSDSGTKQSAITVVTNAIADTSAAEITTNVPMSVNDGLSSVPVPQGGDGCQQGTPTPVNSIKRDETKNESGSFPSSTVDTIESCCAATLQTIPPSLAAIAPSTEDSFVKATEVQSTQISIRDSSDITAKSDAVTLPVRAELPTESTAQAVSTPVPQSDVSVEIAQVPRPEIQSYCDSSSDVCSAEAFSAPAMETAGKDGRKKKNKKKDVNSKGQNQQQGTDMDAYIVEADPTVAAVTEVTAVSADIEKNLPIRKPIETASQEEAVELPVAPVTISSSLEAPVGTSISAPKIDTKTVDEPMESVAVKKAQAVDTAIESVETEKSTPGDLVPTPQGSVAIENDAVVDGSSKESPTAIADGEEVVDTDGAAEAQKTDLQYKYAEEQWSPLNPEGKKQYDREFMMQLQFANLSRQKPANLPPLPDIILNELAGSRPEIGKNRSIELGRMGIGMAPDFTPGYVKSSPSGSKRGPVQRNSINKAMGGMGPSGPSGSRKVISLTLQQDIQLNKADNAWKPTLVTKKDMSSDHSLATEELYKKVRGILNKLTPQKFATLMQQVLDLQIDTEERLKGCIDIIFEKAISEPNFSVAYANMAKRMLALSVQRELDSTQTVTFRTLLLNKCQHEFEKDKLEEMDLADRQKKIDEADSEEKKKLLTEELVEAATKSKRRSLGNIRFIGELYKLRMLTEAIMHECLVKLLRSNDEDSLECLCQLLTTTGQELDNKQSKLQPRMDMYFKQLDALINEKNKVSARIRFMLLDTIDLRKSNWVPRRANNNPKTIEQIHKEAQEEEQKKHADMQKSVMERGRRGGGAGAGGGRGGPPQGGNVGEDGWNTVTRPPKSQIVDPQRLKLTKREQVDDNIQLGPGGRGMTTWQLGSRGGGKSTAPPATPDSDRNRYSLLNNPGFEQHMDSRNRGPSNRGSATPSGTGLRPNRDYQGSVSGPAGRPVGPRPSLERNTENNRQDRRDFVSPASSRSASREPRPAEAVVERQAPPMGAVSGAPVKAAERELSLEEIEKKTKSLMEEYLHLNDLKEATECVKELNSPNSLHLFVYHSLVLNLERSSLARQRTGVLLHHLIKNRVLSNSQCVEGLRSVLELAVENDMEVDIPHVWQYFGDMIGPIVEEDGAFPLVSLRNVCQPLLDCHGVDKTGVVVSVVLHNAVQRLGHQRVAELWQQSGLKWSEFVPEDKVDKFLNDHKLEFTQIQTEPQPPKPVTLERLQEDLNRIYQDPTVPDEQVLDYLKENVGDIDGKCVRALTTAICSTALSEVNGGESDEKKILFNVQLIKKRLALLTKIINSRAEFEIEVLFAIQVVINKKDVYTGAISELFDTLYDEDVVSDATFFRWRDDRMYGEQIGRGVTINTLNQFFKWLEEDTTTS